MPHPGTADVVFQEEKLRKIVDVSLTGKGFDVHASEESGAWNEAIDLVVDKAKKQLIKNKEKLQSHRAEA
jgi:putative sigma-54 modulation protein